jgi:hypothetical protein
MAVFTADMVNVMQQPVDYAVVSVFVWASLVQPICVLYGVV